MYRSALAVLLVLGATTVPNQKTMKGFLLKVTCDDGTLHEGRIDSETLSLTAITRDGDRVAFSVGMNPAWATSDTVLSGEWSDSQKALTLRAIDWTGEAQALSGTLAYRNQAGTEISLPLSKVRQLFIQQTRGPYAARTPQR